MKAIIATKYGSPDVLQLREIPRPVPGPNEVLIKIHTSTVTMGDCEVRSFTMPLFLWLPIRLFMGITKPRQNILGQEVAGEVVSVGSEVTKFKAGDAVFASTEMSMGGYAEYVCLPETTAMAVKPGNVSFEQAVTLPVGGLNAMHFIHEADIQPGETMLINGAGGSIGTYAVQIAKLFGAEVTAIDHTDKLEMLRSIGADLVVDYTRSTFTEMEHRYDIIFDVIGTRVTARHLRCLNENGRYLVANPRLNMVFKGWWVSLTSSKKLVTGLAGERTEDLDYLANLISEGEIEPVIDSRYPLEKVANAHRFVETGQKKGSVVVNIIPESEPQRINPHT